MPARMASGERSIKLNETESRLRQLLLDASTYIGAREGCATPELRFTGGWVRDKLLGSTSHDVDIGIDNMTGYRFATLLKEYLEQPDIRARHKHDALGTVAKIGANPEKSKHLETATTKIMGIDLDLVNLRKETYSNDSRNPTVEFGTPTEDALRRDSTVNALFYNLRTDQLEDWTGRGLADIDNSIIRTPLAPLQTFKDDPLRVLRCIRFASRLGYDIAPEVKVAMADDTITVALRLKISRERIGVEITKMLKDPNAHRAIALIDELRLYNTIFTDPTDATCKLVETDHWHQAYETLASVLQAPAAPKSSEQRDLHRLKSTLLRNPDEIYLAWMLVCLVPWARQGPKQSQKASSKKRPSAAYLTAREGIKADNKICRVVDAAATRLQAVIDLKNLVGAREESGDSCIEQKPPGIVREVHGQAIRAWGSDWRSIVIYALLSEVMELQDTNKVKGLLAIYVNWLFALEANDLLDVDQLVPLVKGDQLCKALGGVKAGPWTKKALDIVVNWQLRNPDDTDPSHAIAEVVDKRNELSV